MIKKWYGKLSAYPRLRIGLIIVVLIVIFVAVTNIFSSSSVKKSAVPASQINKAHLVANREHSIGAAQYNKLSRAQQKMVRARAERSGQSYFQKNLLKGGSKVEPKKVEPKKVEKVESPQNFYRQKMHEAQAKHSVRQPQTAQAHTVPVQPQGASQAKMQQDAQTLRSAMQSQISQLATSWTLPTAATTVGDLPAAGSASSGGSVSSTQVAIKAGSILFAVLDTALNSDQPGTPVLATIVSGKLRGAKLLGTFTREKDKLVVKFSTMTLKTRSASIGISAYAIDAKTAQNALASSVNNHYLLRYGSLFASAFLEGFGTAYSSVNSDYGSGGLFNVYSAPRVAPTTKTAMYQGIGQVGTSLGQSVQKVFDTPPTVKLKQGAGMGILFMSDVSM